MPEWTRTPPGLGWLVALCVPMAALLWSFSHPGVEAITLVLGGSVLLVFGAIWVGRFFCWAVGTDREHRLRWAIAPVLVAVCAALIVTDMPVRARFALDRDDFDAFAAEFDADAGAEGWRELDPPVRLGTYDITAIGRLDGNLVIYEKNGFLFDDAGFVRTADLASLAGPGIEDPRFTDLGGGWYAWQASW